jgi:hypothetical protein
MFLLLAEAMAAMASGKKAEILSEAAGTGNGVGQERKAMEVEGRR